MHLRLINCDSAILVTACAQQFGDLGISVYLFVNAVWPFDLYLQLHCFCDIKWFFIRDTPSFVAKPAGECGVQKSRTWFCSP